jgi:hypothetical protein
VRVARVEIGRWRSRSLVARIKPPVLLEILAACNLNLKETNHLICKVEEDLCHLPEVEEGALMSDAQFLQLPPAASCRVCKR